jgi:predicted ribosomally synthesized peptide with SipW-like signal peptide
MNLRKILLSVFSIGVVALVAFVATSAFFSDSETSTGNVFVAGAIDLKIDNSSYGFDWNDPQVTEPTGVWGQNLNNSWESKDLDGEVFFSFYDLKPGDYGEDTISVVVQNNDAWACMNFNLTGTPENGITEPEAEAGDITEEEGELQKYLSFIFWYDDGDNVLEEGEVIIQELSGLPGDIFTGGWLPIADSSNGPALVGGQTYHIGKGWCFGTIEATPVAQSENPNGPTPGNTGFTCSGIGDHNDAQTDGITVDVSFYAVQARHNADFTCASMNPQPAPRPVIDGVVGTEEWAGCTDITIAGDKGSACVLAYTDYMYVLYQIADSTDDRLNENSVGNDQLGLNINPTDGVAWGKPYGIILQTGTDPAAFTSPDPNNNDNSSGTTMVGKLNG